MGAFVAGALDGLAARGDLDVSAFAVSWRRRRGVVGLVPPGVGTAQRAMPARPLHRAWERTQLPPVEWFVGRRHVVHGTNFVVPPSRTAARVVTVHDLTVVRFPELCDGPTLAFPAQIRRAIAQGAWVHTPSAFVAGEVVEAFGADPERVVAVHHGIPPLGPPPPGTAVPGGDAVPAPGLRPVVLPPGTGRYVLSIGTVEPRKDYPTLVRAFSDLAASTPDLALVIVGRDGWGAERLHEAVAASPFRGRIVRPGYLDDAGLGVALAGASALAYPSVYEGFGFPPLQAMAAGVPVVTTSVGAVPEVVGDAALLVAPGDADGLAGALASVLSGPAVAEPLVARGRERSAEFSWSTCAEGLAHLYRRASDERTGMAARRQGGRRWTSR